VRIAIDARLNAYRIGGIPQYTRQLAAALAAAAPHDTLVTMQHIRQPEPLVIAPNTRRMALVTPPHHRYEAITLPIELLRARASVIHFPDLIMPPRCPAPAVITIHDLAFLHFPEILDDAARRYYGQIERSARQAAAVIAVSEATRQDIVERLGLPVERIDMVYEAAAPYFRPLGLAPGSSRLFGENTLMARDFLLFVSTIEPRKNLPMLLQALRICRDRHPERGYQLVVAGARGWREAPIYQTIQDLRLGDAVRFLGPVSDDQLCWLYNACRIYLNPSRYEGFGLPLLEALACGAPCVASSSSSLPEVAGDAAICLPPDDPGAWADAVITLWENDAERARLGLAGRARAQRFSWERAAQETLAIYRRVGT
jgi:glycosyltransferase involved in cell wall biosynthesis